MGLLDLIFPKKCFGCGKVGGYLCKSCVAQLPKAKSVCPYCYRFSFQGKTHPLCAKRFGIDGLYSVWEYKGVIKNLILSLKYRFSYDLADDLVAALIEVIRKEKFKPKNFLLAPVPLYETRQNWRGFNHARLLCGKIAEKTGWEYAPDLVIKTKDTLPQVGLKGKERGKNIKGVFALNLKYTFFSYDYLIFDDVTTTGSTLKEIAKILKKRGAKRVWGLTLAA